MEAALPISIEAAQRLCKMIASKVYRHASRHHSLEDLTSEAWVGLLHAARRYKASEGARFNTYATRRIYGQLIDFMRSDSWMTRGEMQKVKRGELPLVRVGHFSEFDGKTYDVTSYRVKQPLDDRDELEVLTSRIGNVGKRMLEMYYFRDMTMQEIADSEGVGLAAVSLRIKHAMLDMAERNSSWE